MSETLDEMRRVQEGWDQRKRVKEEEFFKRENEAALEKLAETQEITNESAEADTPRTWLGRLARRIFGGHS